MFTNWFTKDTAQKELWQKFVQCSILVCITFEKLFMCTHTHTSLCMYILIKTRKKYICIQDVYIRGKYIR